MISSRFTKVFIAYGILTFVGFLLTLLFIKFLYATDLAGGICWTTDCEVVSLYHLYLTYSILLIANGYVFIFAWTEKHPIAYLLILMITLIIQCGGFGIMFLPEGYNYAAPAIFYGFAGIMAYEYVTHKQKLGVWKILVAEVIIFMIFGMSNYYAEEILLGSRGADFNPEHEFIISKVINYSFLALMVIQVGYSIDRNKPNQLSWR